jgi:hypothetical protein
VRHLPSAFAFVAAAAACGTTSDTPPAACPPRELVVAASDYSSSRVGGAPANADDFASGVDLGKDPALAWSSGHVYFLARDDDLVFELDPSCGTPTARFSVHDLAPKTRPANPHDLALASDGTAWVALYNAPTVALVKEGKVVGSIDLSPFDGDGNPQAESIRIVGDKAYVALERLDDHDFPQSKQASQMLRIDVATHATEGTVDLVGRDPFGSMAELDGALYLAEPRSFDIADEDAAGIERFDTKSGTTALLTSEKDLGGSVAEVAVTAGCGAAIVAGPQKDVNPTSLVSFDPTTGRITGRAVLGPTPGYDLQGLAWRDGTLYVGDRRAEAGGYRVHVFDRDDACILHESDRSIVLPQRPVALRPAR